MIINTGMENKMIFKEYEPISISNWVLTIVALGIPFFNIILIFYWALSRHSHPSKKNFARAFILIVSIVIVCYITFFIAILPLSVY